MKDMMSGGLTKLAATSKQKSQQVQGYLNDIIKQNKKLEDSMESVGRKAEGSGNRLLSWGKRLAVGLGAASIMAAAGAFMSSSAQAAIKHESVNKSFQVLTGNKGVGDSLAGGLNDLQQKTILGPEVFKNAQTMLGFGMGAEKVIPTLKMLGDVSMGDADKLQSLTLAFSQVQAAGKLTGQDLLQFINAGFNPLNEIAKKTGLSIGELKKKMEDGGISAKMIEDAFVSATGKGGLFDGMMNQMAETTGGKIAQLQGGIEALKISVGERMKPAIGSFVSGLTSVVSRVKGWFDIPIEKKLGDQIIKIHALQAELTSSNTSHERQLELLRDLEQINPNIVKGIDDQKISYGKLAENINNVTGALRNKIFLEKFDKANADVLADYAQAQQIRNDSFGTVMSIVAQADPKLAQRTDLTLGQKQMMAMQILKDRIAADPNHGITGGGGGTGGGAAATLSADMELKNQMIQAINAANTADNELVGMLPQINSINQTKAALSKQIDKFTGVAGMVPTKIEDGKKPPSATPDGAGDVAKGITGGGPRVINISGVKFTDKIEIHAGSTEEGFEGMERRLEDMFLRILNSGASVQ